MLDVPLPAAAAQAAAEDVLRRFRRAVVIAPHPDDEVLGCGGLVAAACSAGCAVTVLYVTDGAASHLGSAVYPPARLRELRESEARAALHALGVSSEPVFLRVPDGTLATIGRARASALTHVIASALGSAAPTLVLGPWRRDPHPDHRATAAIVERVCSEIPQTTLLEYFVWLGVRGETHDLPSARDGELLRVDVKPYASKKQRALTAHRSQLGEVIEDASWAFVLPPDLVASAVNGQEHFVRVG